MTRVAATILLLVVAPSRAEEAFRIEESKGTVVVTVGGTRSPVPEAALRKWIRNAAHAVSVYYGRFPVPEARLLVETGGEGHVGGGFTQAAAPFVRIRLGAGTVGRDLDEDWRLTHEFVHLATPSSPSGAAWFSEGVATYVEPIARARSGTLETDDVWKWLVRGLPKGLPDLGDQGLDRTRTWGRTYWGGALFCLLADLEIREKTKNAKSLDDALRGILDAGGDGTSGWSLAWTLEKGDAAVGGDLGVLRRLHARLGGAPVVVDLDALFGRLGVSMAGGRVSYDETAPLSAIRRSITARPRP